MAETRSHDRGESNGLAVKKRRHQAVIVHASSTAARMQAEMRRGGRMEDGLMLAGRGC